jgi:hypothetical protein
MLGCPIVSFFYQDRRYTFYQFGPAVIEYLKENLAPLPSVLFLVFYRQRKDDC